jgi:hypothetical protein|tara:strand:+ start:128 stop:547 length:420 start_codon:yes stop_codon:yes gene_type:complete
MARKKKIKELEKIKKENKYLQEAVKSLSLYKQLTDKCMESIEAPKNIIKHLKFTMKNIRLKNKNLLERIIGTSGNLNVKGICPVCDINLFEPKSPTFKLRPKESSLSCAIKNCPIPEKENFDMRTAEEKKTEEEKKREN